MADMDAEILIKILTAYEAGGTDAARAAMNDLNRTTVESAKVTETAHGGWRAWMHTIHGTSQLAEGNIRGLGGALHGIAGILGSSGFGIGAIIGLGGAAVAGVIHHWQEAKEKIQAAKEKLAEFNRTAEEKLKTDSLDEQIKLMAEFAKEASIAAENVEKITKAENELSLAKLGEKQAALKLEEAGVLANTPEDQKAVVKAQYALKSAEIEQQEKNTAAAQKVGEAQVAEKKRLTEIDRIKASTGIPELLVNQKAAELQANEAAQAAAGIATPKRELTTEEISSKRKEAEKLRSERGEMVDAPGTESGVTAHLFTPEERAQRARQADAIDAGIEANQAHAETVKRLNIANSNYNKTVSEVAEQTAKLGDGQREKIATETATRNAHTTEMETHAQVLTAETGVKEAQKKAEEKAAEKTLHDLEKTALPEAGVHEGTGGADVAEFKKKAKEMIRADDTAGLTDLIASVTKKGEVHSAAMNRYMKANEQALDALIGKLEDATKKLETVRDDHS